MKMIPFLVAVLVVAPTAHALSTSTTASPPTAAVGHAVTMTYTRTASLTDGLQNGTVTPRITGPVNTTLPAASYHFTATFTVYESATLTWTWTPTLPGNYTLTFTDTPTHGNGSNQTRVYHVQEDDGQGGGGGTIERKNPLRGQVALAILAAGVLLVAFAQPRTARKRLARLTGLALIGVAAIIFLLILWW